MTVSVNKGKPERAACQYGRASTHTELPSLDDIVGEPLISHPRPLPEGGEKYFLWFFGAVQRQKTTKASFPRPGEGAQSGGRGPGWVKDA